MFTSESLAVLLKEPKWVTEAKKEADKLYTHLHGSREKTAAYLDKIERYETAKQYQARQDNCTPNKHLFRELLRPVDKIFTAKGGSKTYEINAKDTIRDEFLARLNNITGGRSVTKWLRDIWQDKYFTQPAGLIFMEWKVDNGVNITYPTFKDISVIRNYERSGRQVLWVIFEPYDSPDKQRKFCRTVDDLLDQIWDVTDPNSPKQVAESIPYPVPFGYCPALVNGTTEAPNGSRMLSELDCVIDLADKYLRTTSVKNIHEFQHGIPVYWEYQSKCIVCNGTTVVNGKTCPACDGSGINTKRDISDKKVLATPKDGDPIITPDVAGFVEPSHETWNQLRDEQKQTVIQIHDTFWGTHREEATNETATGKYINQQPVNDKLGYIAEVFQSTETWIVDMAGEMSLGDLYQGATIIYGRRFLIETASAIWEDYQKARSTGAPDFVLDFKLSQYIASELGDDIQQYAAMSKLMKVEPFVHLTTDQVIDMPILAEDKMMKVYFSDWCDTLEQSYINQTDETKLKEDLKQYVIGKYVEQTTVKNEQQTEEV